MYSVGFCFLSWNKDCVGYQLLSDSLLSLLRAAVSKLNVAITISWLYNLGCTFLQICIDYGTQIDC